jgi:hypothetical protein
MQPMGELIKLMNRVTQASTPNLWTRLLVIDSSKIIICFLKKYFLFNYMITKRDNRKIKFQPNTKMLKTIMEKKKVKLIRPFLWNCFFLEYEKQIDEKKSSSIIIIKKKTPQQTNFGFVIFFLKKQIRKNKR